MGNKHRQGRNIDVVMKELGLSDIQAKKLRTSLLTFNAEHRVELSRSMDDDAGALPYDVAQQFLESHGARFFVPGTVKWSWPEHGMSLTSRVAEIMRRQYGYQMEMNRLKELERERSGADDDVADRPAKKMKRLVAECRDHNAAPVKTTSSTNTSSQGRSQSSRSTGKVSAPTYHRSDHSDAVESDIDRSRSVPSPISDLGDIKSSLTDLPVSTSIEKLQQALRAGDKHANGLNLRELESEISHHPPHLRPAIELSERVNAMKHTSTLPNRANRRSSLWSSSTQSTCSSAASEEFMSADLSHSARPFCPPPLSSIEVEPQQHQQLYMLSLRSGSEQYKLTGNDMASVLQILIAKLDGWKGELYLATLSAQGQEDLKDGTFRDVARLVDAVEANVRRAAVE